jgi:hypothetical protein
MGEKPLSIDEAPQPVTVAAGGPLGGFDTPPPGSVASAGTISTTRSNIRNQGAVAHDPATEAGGAGAVADQARGTEQVTGDAGMAIKEQGVLKSHSTGHGSSGPIGTVKTGGNMVAPAPPEPSDSPPPITDGTSASAVGPIRPGSGSPGPTYPPIPDGGNAAVAPTDQGNLAEAELDEGALRSVPGGVGGVLRGVAGGPVRPGPGPTYPNDPPPDDAPPTNSAGSGSPAGMAAEGDPIPGIDVKLGKNPGAGAVGGAPPEGGGASPPPYDNSPPAVEGIVVRAPDGTSMDIKEIPPDRNVMQAVEAVDDSHLKGPKP